MPNVTDQNFPGQQESQSMPGVRQDSTATAIMTVYRRLLQTLAIFAIFTSGFYFTVYFSTGVWQNLVAAGFIVGACCLAPIAYFQARRGNPTTAGIMTLIGVSIAYGINELLWKGLTPYHTLGGVLLIVLAGMLILPRKIMIWLTVAGLYGFYIFLANRIQPLPRYDVANLYILVPYAIVTNIILVLALFALIVRSLSTRTIRTRLLVYFIMLGLIPVVVSSTVSSYFSAQSSQDRARAQLESVATIKEAQIRNWAENLRVSLNLFSPPPNERSIYVTVTTKPIDDQSYKIAHDQLRGEFQTFLILSGLIEGLFEEVFLLDSDGNVALSTDLSQEGLNKADTPYYQNYKSGDIKTRVIPYVSPTTKQMSIIVAAPIMGGNNQLIGILTARADFSRLDTIMNEQTGLGNTGETYLVSEVQTLLTPSRFPGYNIGETLPSSDMIIEVIDKGLIGSGLYQTYRGTNVFGVYRWMPEFRMALFAEQEQSETLQPTYQALTMNAGVIALAGIVALLAGWYASNGITNPLGNLAKTTEAIAAGNLELSASVEREDEIGALAKSFNSMTSQLRTLVGSLEKRVTERTHELERRSLQLQVAAEVARDSTATRDMNELFYRAVNLIRERFGFYHVGIFLVDERKEYAILRAATGEAGRQMLLNGHKLKVGEGSIVGYVTRLGLSRIALDVGIDSMHFKNPLLPDTHSEVALPLKVSGQVIGALDVQSVQQEALDDESVRILQTMADQLAIAIENTRLFHEMSQTVRELETVYGRYTRESWLSLTSHTEQALSFLYRGLGVEVATEQNQEAEEALQKGKTVLTILTPDNISRERQTIVPHAPVTALAIPLKLRGQIVGTLNLRFEGQTVPPEAISTFEEIANRLTLVLENARLLQDAQRFAMREQQLNLITTQIRKSANVDSILQNTVHELGKALGISRTFVQLITYDNQATSGPAQEHVDDDQAILSPDSGSDETYLTGQEVRS